MKHIMCIMIINFENFNLALKTFLLIVILASDIFYKKEKSSNCTLRQERDHWAIGVTTHSEEMVTTKTSLSARTYKCD